MNSTEKVKLEDVKKSINDKIKFSFEDVQKLEWDKFQRQHSRQSLIELANMKSEIMELVMKFGLTI